MPWSCRCHKLPERNEADAARSRVCRENTSKQEWHLSSPEVMSLEEKINQFPPDRHNLNFFFSHFLFATTRFKAPLWSSAADVISTAVVVVTLFTKLCVCVWINTGRSSFKKNPEPLIWNEKNLRPNTTNADSVSEEKFQNESICAASFPWLKSGWICVSTPFPFPCGSPAVASPFFRGDLLQMTHDRKWRRFQGAVTLFVSDFPRFICPFFPSTVSWSLGVRRWPDGEEHPAQAFWEVCVHGAHGGGHRLGGGGPSCQR